MSALLREPPSVAQALRGFVALADKTARARAAYRAAILVTLFTSALGYVVFFLVWRELYRSGTASALMPKAELFSYLLVAPSSQLEGMCSSPAHLWECRGSFTK